MQIKAIESNIFVDKEFGDCSNNGISSRHNTVYIASKEGPLTFETENLPENFCDIIVKDIKGKQIPVLVPHYIVEQNLKSIFGGTFTYSTLKQFLEISSYPLQIHDRID